MDILREFDALTLALPALVTVALGIVAIVVYVLRLPQDTPASGATAKKRPGKRTTNGKAPKDASKAPKKSTASAEKPQQAPKPTKKSTAVVPTIAAVPTAAQKPSKPNNKKAKQEAAALEKAAAEKVAAEKVAAEKAAAEKAAADKAAAKAQSPAPKLKPNNKKAKPETVQSEQPAKPKPAKAPKAKKPTPAAESEADAGNWLTVPTKADKKTDRKPEPDEPIAAPAFVEPTVAVPEPASKQQKNEANLTRQAAEEAVVARPAPFIVHTVDLASLPAVAAKFSSASGGAPVQGFEYFIPALAPPAAVVQPTALRQRIEEAIGDEVRRPVQPHLFDVLSAVKAEAEARAAQADVAQLKSAAGGGTLIGEPEPNNNVAFDELADAWSLQQSKKPIAAGAAKRRVRKD